MTRSGTRSADRAVVPVGNATHELVELALQAFHPVANPTACPKARRVIAEVTGKRGFAGA